MTDAPLISVLESEALDAARARATGQAACLIYVHPDSSNGASLADGLRQLARHFEIVEIRIVSTGIGVVGSARTQPIGNVSDAEITRFLEQAVRAARTAEQAAEDSLRRLRIELLAADASADRETYERKLRLAQQAAEKVEGTLSFRLGHALIHKTKSLKGLRQLPRVLWDLQQDASARRERGGARTSVRRIVRRIARFRNRPVSTRPARPQRSASHREFAAPFPISSGADLRRLRVAGIFDAFTAHAFAPECELIQLQAQTWRAQLAAQPPHLLFVESAWFGEDGSWERKLNQLSREFRELLQHCRDAGIPTVFWNKEDPVHFGTFLNTAVFFDVVFTTDFDCIHRYRELLGHDRVYLLPFAAQPRQHNPIETFERKNAACFAGAYYVRYPERQRDFLRIMIKLLERCPVEIFDRNHGKTDPDYQFPASYREYVVGNLPFGEIDRAYKGYRYAININSIKTSQTMFARRIFELLASNTLTVSNYAKGIRVMFGELVIASDDPTRIAARLDELEHDDAAARRQRLIALRKVMAEHTYQDRLAFVVSKVFGIPVPRLTPTVTVVAAANTAEEAAVLADAFIRQRYRHKRLVAVVPEAHRSVLVARCPDAHLMTGTERAASIVEDEDFVARFAIRDYYGEHYLEDLALACRYFDGAVIGKAARWRWGNSGPETNHGASYRTGQTVPTAAAIIRRDRLGEMSLADLIRRDAMLDDALAIDGLHYCEGGAPHAGDRSLLANVAEPDAVNAGLSLSTILDHAEKMPLAASSDDQPALGPSDLATMFPAGTRNAVTVSHDADGMTLDSTLAIDGREHLHQRGELSLSSLGWHTRARFHLDVTAGLRLEAALVFLDQERRQLGQAFKFAAMNHEVELPSGSAFVRFGMVAVGPGTATVRRLALGPAVSQEPTRVLGRSKILLVTNSYPSSEDLYRNAFVHRRVVDYRRAGVDVDVFCHRVRGALTHHEFEGVDIVTGSADVLRRMLASNPYETVLVHFLDEEMWRELRPRLDELRTVIWIHGAEIHPWHRRRYNLTEPDEVETAKAASERRAELWREVLRPLHPNLHVVTVSRTFAGEIEEDYAVTLPPSQHSVIHNVIDTELFRYVPKPTAQRTRILSIRPFASRQYANDVSVAAILELSKRPWFEELAFHLIGDGPLFETTVAPLRGMRNVLIEQRFVRQHEIAALHRDHGVFLCPTRWDSQGVSRDEAMASGLVPVTTRIAAVPEMVDEDCGFLTPPEDANALADAIDALYHDPARFQRMSEAAAARVRRDRGPEQTTRRELALFTRRS